MAINSVSLWIHIRDLGTDPTATGLCHHSQLCLRWTQPMPGQEISRPPQGSCFFRNYNIHAAWTYCRCGNGKSGKRSLLPYNKNINNNNRIVSVIHMAWQQWWCEMLLLCSSWWIANQLQASCCLLMWQMLREKQLCPAIIQKEKKKTQMENIRDQTRGDKRPKEKSAGELWSINYKELHYLLLPLVARTHDF